MNVRAIGPAAAALLLVAMSGAWSQEGREQAHVVTVEVGEPPETGAQPGTEPEFQPAPASDLDAIQGYWVRTERGGVMELFRPRTVTKLVRGDSETLTTCDHEGNVISAHTAKIRLLRGGPIRVFSYSDLTYTAGPDAGTETGQGGVYLYKVVGDTFVEIWGVLGEEDSDPRILRWTREWRPELEATETE